MLGMGAYTPLDGFMGHDDWRSLGHGDEACQRRVLAHTRSRCRWQRGIADSLAVRRGGGACRCRDRRGARPAHGAGEIRDRPRARMQARVSHHRSQASRRGEGDAAGRGQHRRPCDRAFGGRISGEIQGSLSAARGIARRVREAGLEAGLPPSRRAIPCIAATSIWPRSRRR